jgi:hypothetical protein
LSSRSPESRPPYFAAALVARCQAVNRERAIVPVHGSLPDTRVRPPHIRGTAEAHCPALPSRHARIGKRPPVLVLPARASNPDLLS